MWLDEYHADGLRWDAITYIQNIEGNEGIRLMTFRKAGVDAMDQTRKFRNAFPVKSASPRVCIVTPGSPKTGAGGAGFNAQWDSEFVNPVRQAVIAPDDASRDLGAVSKAIEYRYDLDAFRRVIFTESHDEVANGRARVPEEIWPGKVDSWFSKKRSTLGGALVLTSPGIPMIFQGQELLEDRWFQDKAPDRLVPNRG